MTKLVIFLSFLFLIFHSGCMVFREYPVEYDYSYQGRFHNYKTWSLIESQVKDSVGELYNPVVETIIKERMKFLGYREVSRKPNLLVSYRIYFDSLSFKGYEQRDIQEWARRPDRDLEYRAKKLNMKEGTLLIQFFDRRKGQVIWNGYVTSTYGDLEFNDRREIRNAVASILDKYRFFADGFLEEMEKAADNK